MEVSSKVSAGLMFTLMACTGALAQFLVWQDTTHSSFHEAMDFYREEKVDVNDHIKDIAYPTIQAVNQRIALHEEFDPSTWAQAHDAQDGDITEALDVYGNVDNTQKGEYELRYVVRNSYGLKSTKHMKVIVD